jgi:predicted short-subunit dehydrogenase-like oxidoreductase (DUF2520 family)
MLPSKVLIIGRGRLGNSLQAALQAAGITADMASARTTLDDSRVPFATGDLILLSVPDGKVAQVALALNQRVAAAGTPVVHLSGALNLEPLAPLRDHGCPVGSLHPLRPFPTALPPSAFHGATIAVDASDAALLAMLSGLAQTLGARPKHVGAGERAVYHAAAVMASTYVVVLAEHAARLLSAIGWDADEALASLLPLLRGTVENLAAEGLPDALTGPLRRGDAETVAAHVRAMSADAQLAPTLDIYRRLGLAAIAIAQQVGLSDVDAERIAAELSFEVNQRDNGKRVKSV